MVAHPVGRMTYCIDTSSLIAAWNERYPKRNFGTFWESMDGLVSEGRLISPVEVKYEIKRKEDGLYTWVQARSHLFVDLTTPVQDSARKVLRKFPHLVKAFPGRTSADPFVIALAEVTDAMVITEEGKGGIRKPRIPLVCKEMNIPCTNLLGLIREEDWKL